MKKKIIGTCPICNHQLSVSKLNCNNCGTEISGNFKLSKFDYLTVTELEFIETFIKVQGNFKEVEKELNISYPTIKKSLESIITKLGYDQKESTDRKLNAQEILDQLHKKEITAQQATTLLEEINNG